jgi:hypothetical protein
MQKNNAAELPVLAPGSEIALTYRGKSEPWRVVTVEDCAEKSAVDFARRGWEAKVYTAERILTGRKTAHTTAFLYRAQATGEFEIVATA